MELQLLANYPFKSLPFYKNVPVQRQFAQSVMLPRVFHPAHPALSSHLTSSCSADRPPPRQSAGLRLMCVCLESEIKGTLFFCFGFFVCFFCIIPLSLVPRSDSNEVVEPTPAFRHHRVSTGSGSGLSRCPETYVSSAQVKLVRTPGVSECMSPAV